MTRCRISDQSHVEAITALIFQNSEIEVSLASRPKFFYRALGAKVWRLGDCYYATLHGAR